MFLTTFAAHATGRTAAPDANGDRISIKAAASSASAAVILHFFGLASKRFVSPIRLAKITPPSCPTPSFSTQFRAPAMTGAAVAAAVPPTTAPPPKPTLPLPTTPTASSRVCVDRTIPALPATDAAKAKTENRAYPGATE